MKLKGTKLFFAFAAVLAAGALMPHPALAQATNGIGTIMTNVASTSIAAETLLTVISYVIGTAVCFWGVMKLKNWADGQAGLGDGLWRIIGGALLIALPDVIQKTLNSFFGTWTRGSSISGNSAVTQRISGLHGNYTANGAWIGLDQAMLNFVVDIYEPGKILCAWAAWLVGVSCMITGIYRLAQSGQAAQGRAPSLKGTIGYIFGGSLMLAAGNVMDTVTTTLFGSSSTTTFASLYYSVPGVDQTKVNNVVQALFAFVELIGWIAVIRGIYLLVKLAQGGGDKTHAHAFSHIIFGACAINMYAVTSMLQTSLGMKLVN